MTDHFEGKALPSFEATITFDSSGHYSAHSPGDAKVVFYYGSNVDSSLKTYTIDNVMANGEGSGEIVIYFGPSDTNTDELRHIALSADLTQLSFEYWHAGVYGPMVFALTRQN